MLRFSRGAIIGLCRIGSSLARAINAQMTTVRVTDHDASAEVHATAEQIRFCDDVTDTPGAAVMDADLVILCVPVGVMGPVAAEIAADLPADAIIRDRKRVV